MGEALISRGAKSNNIEVVQKLGDSTSSVLSQDASSTLLSEKQHVHETKDIIAIIQAAKTNRIATVTSAGATYLTRPGFDFTSKEYFTMYAGRLYTSENGYTWTRKTGDAAGSTVGYYCFYIGRHNTYLVIPNTSTTTTYRLSSDKGKTWSTVPAYTTSGDRRINAIVDGTISSSRYFVGTPQGLYQTYEFKDFNKINIPVSTVYELIRSGNYVYGIVEDITDGKRKLLCSSNLSLATLTWELLDVLPSQECESIAKLGNNLVVGLSNNSTANEFYYTSDNGTTWTTVADIKLGSRIGVIQNKLYGAIINGIYWCGTDLNNLEKIDTTSDPNFLELGYIATDWSSSDIQSYGVYMGYRNASPKYQMSYSTMYTEGLSIEVGGTGSLTKAGLLESYDLYTTKEVDTKLDKKSNLNHTHSPLQILNSNAFMKINNNAGFNGIISQSRLTPNATSLMFTTTGEVLVSNSKNLYDWKVIKPSTTSYTSMAGKNGSVATSTSEIIYFLNRVDYTGENKNICMYTRDAGGSWAIRHFSSITDDEDVGNVTGALYSNSQYAICTVSLDYLNSYVYTSTDGKNYTKVATIEEPIQGLKLVNGVYFLLGKGKLFRSTDLINWTTVINISNEAQFNQVVGDTGIVYRSETGLTWEECNNITPLSGEYNITSLTTYNGKFVFSGSFIGSSHLDKKLCICRTADGINFTHEILESNVIDQFKQNPIWVLYETDDVLICSNAVLYKNKNKDEINIVQELGNSETDAMSQKANTNSLFYSYSENGTDAIFISGEKTGIDYAESQSITLGKPNSDYINRGAIQIGTGVNAGQNAVAIANGAVAGEGEIALGQSTNATLGRGVAIGEYSATTRPSEVSFGQVGSTRLIANVTDPLLPQDVATKKYVDENSSSVDIVQNLGSSTTSVMSQNAVRSALNNDYSIYSHNHYASDIVSKQIPTYTKIALNTLSKIMFIESPMATMWRSVATGLVSSSGNGRYGLFGQTMYGSSDWQLIEEYDYEKTGGDCTIISTTNEQDPFSPFSIYVIPNNQHRWFTAYKYDQNLMNKEEITMSGLPSASYFPTISYLNGVFVGVRYGPEDEQGRSFYSLWMSTDVANWTKVPNIQVSDVRVLNGEFVAYAEYNNIIEPHSGKIYTSTDGTNWTEKVDITSIFGENSGVNSIGYSSGTYMSSAYINSQYKIIKSTDLINWTEISAQPDKIRARLGGYWTNGINKFMFFGSEPISPYKNWFALISSNGDSVEYSECGAVSSSDIDNCVPIYNGAYISISGEYLAYKNFNIISEATIPVTLGGTGATTPEQARINLGISSGMPEFGTFTPALGSSATQPSVTYTEQSGVYWKIGKLCIASGRITCNINSEGSRNGIITGLPFIASDEVATQNVIFSEQHSGTTTSTLAGKIEENTNYILMGQHGYWTLSWGTGARCYNFVAIYQTF